MEAKAVATLRAGEPSQGSAVVDLIRGKSVEDASADPQVHAARMRRRSSRRCSTAPSPTRRRTTRSPAGRSTSPTTFVDEGPTLKRIRPRAHGSRVPDRQADEPYHRRRQAERGGVAHHGSEDLSRRTPPRHHRELAFALVSLARTTARRSARTSRFASSSTSASLAPLSPASRSSARATSSIIELWTARPGIVIGKKGSEVDALRKDLEKITGSTVTVNIVEIKRPELDATLVAQSVAEQLVGRVASAAPCARRSPRR